MPPGTRREYLDWLRGVAVLIMIEAHLVDSWTGAADRQTPAFAAAMIVGGMGGSLFLFLAGSAVALSASSKLRRTGDPEVAASVRHASRARDLRARFSLPDSSLDSGVVLTGGAAESRHPQHHGAVDCGGRLSVGKSAFDPQPADRLQHRHGFCHVADAADRERAHRRSPRSIEAYIRPIARLSNFVFFPWMAFLFAGVTAGLFLDATPSAHEARANAWIFIAGSTIASRRLRGVLPTEPVSALQLLAHVAELLLHSRRPDDRSHRRRLLMAVASGRIAEVEPTPARWVVRRCSSTGFTSRWCTA